MKILITGARGNFPTALIRRLLLVRHELVLLDHEPMEAPEGAVSIQADIRDSGAVVHAMTGCEAVIHAAACSEHEAESRNYEDYFSVNVAGTHNVLRSMLLCGVKHLVFSSSDAVYGSSTRGHRVIQESLPCLPTHIFAQTKLLGEEMCRFFARRHGFRIALLRYGRFAPADWRTAGLGRLTNWVDREDVAQANELALGCVLSEDVACQVFQIYARTPFTDDDWPGLEVNPVNVIERYYPGASDLLAAHGLHVPHIHHRYDISTAVTSLGYEPQQNFEQFLARLRKS